MTSEELPSLTHQWWINPRDYARHEARRGRRFAYDHLEPERTALVVVDMTAFFVAENPYCEGIVPRVSYLAESLRALGSTVAWVLPKPHAPSSWEQEFYGGETARLYASPDETREPADRLWNDLEVRSGDLVVEKSTPSAFFPGGSDLHEKLVSRGVDSVLITGTVSNVCCESTARDASAMGYRVVFIADATAASNDDAHNATLTTIYRSFGDVRSTIEVLDLLGQPGEVSA
jgi:nicotinamidase-related amidase